jgi:murein DD-endopeptidase MepM/ murein hydrolase activator NlpD
MPSIANKTLTHIRSHKTALQNAVRSRGLRPSRRAWFLSVVVLLTTVTIASIRPSDNMQPLPGEMPVMPPTQIVDITDIHGQTLHTVIPGYPGAPSATGQVVDSTESTPWTRVTIHRGDTLTGVLTTAKVNASEIAVFARTQPAARELYQLYPGQELRYRTDASGQLTDLVYPVSDIERLHLKRLAGGFELAREKQPFDTRLAYLSGNIQSSLFVDGQNAGLTDAQVMQLVDIFGWDIDFAQDLRPGDSFSIAFEENFTNGQKLNDGPIAAAEFVNQGKVYRAIGFRDETGTLSYFSPEGMSLRRAFLRSPVKFSHITSRFSLGRFHPILKTWRAHTGVDYGAPIGTPIMATASGRVISAGVKGGYGNAVVLKHGGSYSTLYAHMSRFQPKIRAGAYVEQGQIIGYVGQTGLSTGPHLHYEFQVDGTHRNPLTFHFPQAEPIRAEQKNEFFQLAQQLNRQLDQLTRNVLALNP